MKCFIFFQPYVLLLPNSVLACFIYSYNSLMIFFLRNSVVYLHFKAGVTKFGPGGPVSLQSLAPTLIKHT